VGKLLSVNLAVPRANRTKHLGITGIDKRPASDPVRVRAPGPKGTGLGSGLDGDQVFDIHHGGDDQAVYAYAREDLDVWEAELGRTLPGGVFGENLTTAGVDVTGALIGERWRVGDEVELEVAVPRIPCGTFAAWMADSAPDSSAERSRQERGQTTPPQAPAFRPRSRQQRGQTTPPQDPAFLPQSWIKRFTARAVPGAYLRVLVPGQVSAGDPITILSRPNHDVTIGVTFRALTLESELLPRLRTVEALPLDVRETASRRTN
jgi:MOSC domain-containing protein YiiM